VLNREKAEVQPGVAAGLELRLGFSIGIGTGCTWTVRSG
jgi:hypothetical protein